MNNKFMAYDYYLGLKQQCNQEELSKEYFQEIAEKFMGKKEYWFTLKTQMKIIESMSEQEIREERKRINEINNITGRVNNND